MKPVNKRRLLDSFALLAWLNEEPGADRVDGLLKDARRSNQSLESALAMPLAAGAQSARRRA